MVFSFVVDRSVSQHKLQLLRLKLIRE